MTFGVIRHFPGGTQENYEASVAAVHPATGLPAGFPSAPPETVFDVSTLVS